MALCVALLCLGTQLSSTLHALVVPHEVCAEHGELVHGERGQSGHAPAHAPVAAAPTQVAGATVQASDSETASHAHDHCTSACQRRDALHVRAPRSLLPLTASSKLAVKLALPARAATSALFSLAPKTSPPA